MKTSIKKKLIAIAMASVMVGSTVSGMAVTASTVNYETVSADSSIVSTGAIVSKGTTSDGWDYALYDDGTAGIVKYSGSAKKVTLPISINGKSIKCLIEGALKGTSVETLVIPDGTPLPVGYSDQHLTWRGFKDSPNLKEVVIGSMFAEAIPEYSFQNCTKLEKVTFTKDFSKKAIEAGRCFIRDSAFEGTAIKSFVVPEGITSIRMNALASKSLVNVSFPTTIVSNIDEGTNRVDLETITGLSVKESIIKNIIAKGESTLVVGIPEKAMIYCSNSSVMKLMCDYNNLSCTDISTINAEKLECEWLGIPYQPDVPEVTTTTSETVPTTTTETKPTETDVTETTTTDVEPTTVTTTTGTTTVSTTTETKPVETTTIETSTQPTTNNAKRTTVSLKNYSKNVYVKGKTIIKPIVRNGKGKTTYRSNNTKIAKVNSKGIVTALKSGTAKITVTNNKVSKVFTIKVLNPKLSKTSVSISRGKSYTLKISGRIGTAKFSTSNKKIATVNKYGKIKVNKKAPKGKTAYITVKTNGVTLKCKVKVK